MKTLEKQRVCLVNITITVPDELGEKISMLPEHVLVDIFEQYIQSNNGDDLEELEFDKAVIDAIGSKDGQEIRCDFAKHYKVRKIHNPVEI